MYEASLAQDLPAAEKATRKENASKHLAGYFSAPFFVVVLTDSQSMYPSYNHHDGPLAADTFACGAALGYERCMLPTRFPNRPREKYWVFLDATNGSVSRRSASPWMTDAMPKKKLEEFVVYNRLQRSSRESTVLLHCGHGPDSSGRRHVGAGEHNRQSGGRAFQRDLLQELVEIESTALFGSTKAAAAMVARLRTAGFPESDMILAGPSPEKQKLVVASRKGDGKPILLIGHLDVVDAPKEGWAAGLDPFRLTERDGFFYGRGANDMKSGVGGAC